MNEYLISSLDQQWKKDPTSRVFFRLAEEYRKGAVYDKAIEVCRAGIEHHPNYLPALICLGRCYREVGLIAEAEETFIKVLASSPDSAHALRGMGTICMEQGRLDEAAKHFDMLLIYEPSDAQAKAALAQIRSAESAEAEAEAEEVVVFEEEPVAEPFVQPEPAPAPMLADADEDDALLLVDEDDDDSEQVFSLDDVAASDPLTDASPTTISFDDGLPAMAMPDTSDEPPSPMPDPIDLEFERALEDADPEPESLFLEAEGEPEPGSATAAVETAPESVAAPAMSADDEQKLTQGLKHEKMEHLEAAQHIYQLLLKKYPGDRIVNGHLARVSTLIDRERKTEKKARMLTNWLDKIKGVYYVR